MHGSELSGESLTGKPGLPDQTTGRVRGGVLLRPGPPAPCSG